MCPSISGIGCIVRSREGVKGVPSASLTNSRRAGQSRSSGLSTCTVMCNYITGGRLGTNGFSTKHRLCRQWQGCDGQVRRVVASGNGGTADLRVCGGRSLKHASCRSEMIAHVCLTGPHLSFEFPRTLGPAPASGKHSGRWMTDQRPGEGWWVEAIRQGLGRG